MPRLRPIYADVLIVRFKEQLGVRVALDRYQTDQALSGNTSYQDSICIQVKQALRNKYNPNSYGWPGRILFAEIETSLRLAMRRAEEAIRSAIAQSADNNAMEQYLEEQYWSNFPPRCEFADHC